MPSNRSLAQVPEWRQFELICYAYLKKKYGDYTVILTRPVSDGGRDVVLSLNTTLGEWTAWAECKMHRQNLGLDEVGKNLVLVVNNKAQMFILMSATHLTDDARFAIDYFADKLNFKLKLLDGDRLVASFHEYPDIFKRYQRIAGGLPATQQTAEPRMLSVHLSEYENVRTMPSWFLADELALSRDDNFFVHVLISNPSPSESADFELSSFGTTDQVHLSSLRGSTLPLLGKLEPMEDILVTFYGSVVKPARRVHLPALQLLLRSRNGGEECTRLSLPVLNLDRLEKLPLVGKRVNEFLNEVMVLLNDLDEGKGRVIDIRGASGVGKTRLLNEILAQARCRGHRAVLYDGSQNGDVRLIRSFMRDLIGLPLPSNLATYKRGDLEGLLQGEGFHPDYQEALDRLFRGDPLDEEHLFRITETTKHFLLARSNRDPQMVLVDNVQYCSKTTGDFLTDLATFVAHSECRVCVGFSTNIELIPIEFRQSANTFLDRIDLLAANQAGVVARHVCQELLPAEARLLVTAAFEWQQDAVHDRDVLVDKVVEKAGPRPFDLLMLIGLLQDESAIERRMPGLWMVPSVARLHEVLKQVPEQSEKILRRRFALLGEMMARRSDSASEGLKTLFSLTTATFGRVPIALLEDFGVEGPVLDEAVARSLFRWEPLDGILLPYHGNIYAYLTQAPGSSASRSLRRSLLHWLNSPANRSMLPEALKIEYFCHRALGGVDQSFHAGKTAIAHYTDLHNHATVVEIGENLLSYITDTDYAQKNVLGYFEVAQAYAESLLHHIAIQDGLAIYRKLEVQIPQLRKVLDPGTLNRFMHRLANAYLHTMRYDKALSVLRRHERGREINGEFRLLVYDRRGVVFTALGDLEAAVSSLTAALELADEQNSSFYRSIVLSDLGYAFLHLTHERNRVVQYYSMARSAHELSTEQPYYREIEVEQQQALSLFLKGDARLAIARAEEALRLCDRYHAMIFYLRLLNLLAASLTHLGEVIEAETVLHRARSLAELYGTERGRWRIFSNLGTLALLNRRTHVAMQYYDMALALLRSYSPRHWNSAKELPLLANLLLIARSTGNHKMATKLLVEAKSDRLTDYYRRLRAFSPFELSADERTPEAFYIAGIRGASLFIT